MDEIAMSQTDAILNKTHLRGVEASLFVIKRAREGKFLSEVIREIGRDMPVKELSLCSSLAYAAIRRRSLWVNIYESFIHTKRDTNPSLPPLVLDCLLIGTAGLLELKHFVGGVLVNALLEFMKSKGAAKYVSLVNAVLHRVGEVGAEACEKLRRSHKIEERAMWAGIPEWSLPAWKKGWNNEELNEIFDQSRVAPCSSLRTAPGERDEILSELRGAGIEAVPSDLFSDSIRLSSTVLPTLVPGFSSGRVTVQTESSMIAADLAREFWKSAKNSRRLVLDMCSGRGVKAGQIARSLPDADIECWEISRARQRAAERELKRLNLIDEGRITLKAGDALKLYPPRAPSLVFLDAPCSGSGTWNRKPESKWKLDWPALDKICATQRSLLIKALNIAATGGIIIYVTCSLLRQENENVVADSLAATPGCVTLGVPWSDFPTREGRPWGTYIKPTLPWLDGFYAAVILKR
ncbi:RNA methyltransferase [Synergistales bacterium]|nr:RNA methyltransferase [Synergistales bacterium]